MGIRKCHWRRRTECRLGVSKTLLITILAFLGVALFGVYWRLFRDSTPHPYLTERQVACAHSALLVMEYAYGNNINKGVFVATKRGPDGTPLRSWRFDAIAQLRYESEKFSELKIDRRLAKFEVAEDRSWFDEKHAAWRGLSIPFFCFAKPGSFAPNVFAVVGPATAADSGLPLDQLRPSLIVLIEARKPDCHWMEPVEIRIDELHEGNRQLQLGTGGNRRFYVMLADMSVQPVNSDISMSELRSMCLIHPEDENSAGDDATSK